MECANGKIFLPTVAHHNYYALYSLSQLYSPPISRAAKSILHYVRCDLSTFPSNLLVRDLQSRSFIFRQIWWYDPIRRYFVLPFDFLPFFFFFLTEIHEKPCGSHKASLLSGARSTCIEYFFFLSMCSLLNINPGLLQETTI